MANSALPVVLASIIAATLTCSPVHASGSAESYRVHDYPVLEGNHRDSGHPALGAAHAVSLSYELSISLSAEDVKRIRKFGPWLTSEGISDNAQVLIRAIQDAQIHGLDPEHYALETLLETADMLAHLDTWNTKFPNVLKNTKHDAEQILRQQLDSELDNSFIKLIKHFGQGAVNGRQNQNHLYRNAHNVNAFNLLVSISNGDQSVSAALSEHIPSHPAYTRLTRTMRNLLTEQAAGVSRTTVRSHNGAKLIMQAKDKDAIAERLLETGDLTYDAYTAVNTDAELIKALRSFQARHGLIQSSFADDKTRSALNTSVQQDIQAVALSLERWRWLPRELGQRHILVNIPDYRVELIENGNTSLTMPAVVGRYENQTPSFSREMTYMEFNPTWTVPATIANEKLIPKERATPGYLISRDFDFLKRDGKQYVTVPPETVTQVDFDAEEFPYTLQQRGGSMNALGRMKFMMPNQHAIYLHDTQAKKHFTLNDRAYSHGCIRLSDPDALATHLMRGDGYSQSRIEKSLESIKTHRIRFRNPIPTHLVYLTTWVDKNNVLQTRPDIYHNDELLAAALNSSETLVSAAEDL